MLTLFTSAKSTKRSVFEYSNGLSLPICSFSTPVILPFLVRKLYVKLKKKSRICGNCTVDRMMCMSVKHIVCEDNNSNVVDDDD